MQFSLLQLGTPDLLTYRERSTEDRLAVIAQSSGGWSCVALGQQHGLFEETLTLMVRIDTAKEHITTDVATAARFGFIPGTSTRRGKA